MTYEEASRLHHEDEVTDKVTQERVKVLSISKEPCMGSLPKQIVIEGVGAKQGYNHWYHGSVK